MARSKKEVDFLAIKKSILSLFESKDGHFKYTKCIASKIRNLTCASMDTTEWKLYYHEGFNFWGKLQEQLNNFYEIKIKPHFIPTGDELIDHARLYNHRQIKKECKKKKWRRRNSNIRSKRHACNAAGVGNT